MIIIEPGHKYDLDSGIISEDNGGQGAFPLKFMKRDDDDWGTLNDGTTNKEVLMALIDRMKFLQEKLPCRENAIIITKLEECLMWDEKRTQDRIDRGVEGTSKE